MNLARLKSWFSLAGTTLLVGALAACGPTVPKIDSVKLGKDKDVTKEETTFNPKDTVYGIASISAPGKATIKWQTTVEKADGVPDNFRIPNADVTVELPGSGTSTYSFPPGDGFPVGKYRLEVHMLDESGVEKDMKAVPFTVAGSSGQMK